MVRTAMPQRWTFHLDTLPDGALHCEGQCADGTCIRRECPVSDAYRIYRDALEFEAHRNNLASRALFAVTAGAPGVRRAQYHDQAFGSWLVDFGPPPALRIVYDGREFLLHVGEGERTVWEGLLRDFADVPDEVLALLPAA